MEQGTQEVDGYTAAPTRPRQVRALLLVSAVCLVLQLAFTDYGDRPEQSSTQTFWLLVGLTLLWFVLRRHSKVARGIVVVTSLVGAVVYGLTMFGESRNALLCLLYLGQALPLLARPIREHVQGAKA